jgi:transaldolase
LIRFFTAKRTRMSAKPTEPLTLLNRLRKSVAVDCDTFDADVARDLGPFIGCTSNQAIAYHELTRVDGAGTTVRADLIKDAIQFAQENSSNMASNISLAEFAVEVMMVKLALRLVPYISGYSHVQTNPKYSYDKNKTVENAQRIVTIFKALNSQYDTKRVCIKIPGTWEGLQACRELEKQGIATLATTLFSMEQAALASHVKCTYIAPYVNELRVHFDKDYVDENKAFAFCAQAQFYYEKIGSKTRVLAASLTSVQEVMMLVGVHQITITPPILAGLAGVLADEWDSQSDGAAFRDTREETIQDYSRILEDQASWNLAFTRALGGIPAAKIAQAISIFCDKQDALEELATKWK